MSQARTLKLPAKRKRVISLTPLIDVVFILLIFFMLASRFEKIRQVEITPPSESRSGASEPQSKSVLITVLPESIIEIEGQTLTQEALKSRFQQNQRLSYLVKVADETSLQDLVSFLDISSQFPDLKISLLPTPK